jgi:hypothetical protein
VAVDLRYRLLHDRSICAAYWVGSDGEKGALLLPAQGSAKGLPVKLREGPDELADFEASDSGDVPGYVAKVREVQGLRDERLNALIAALQAWTAGQAEFPPWLANLVPAWPSVRSQERMLELWQQWRANRLRGDTKIFAVLEAWARKELHLHEWERAARTKYLRWREDYYRRFWASLRRRYRTVVLGDTDWAQLRRKVKPEDQEARYRQDHYHLVSPGRLGALAGTLDTVVVEARDTSRSCHHCGAICQWDQARELEHTCEHCGRRWDQRYNACVNLLARAEARQPTPGTARPPQTPGASPAPRKGPVRGA